MSAVLSGKVALDRVLFATFLSVAYEEGLLRIRKDLDAQRLDLTYEQIRQRLERPIQPEFKRMVLEQITLAPTVLAKDWHHVPMARVYEGELIERNNIQELGSIDKNADEITELSVTTLSEMLTAYGTPLSIAEIGQIATEAIQIFNEEDEYRRRTGKEPASLWAAVAEETMFRAGFYKDHPSEEVEWDRRRLAWYQKATPLIDCIEEYNRLHAIAKSQGILMRVPTTVALETRFNNPKSNVESDTAILQVAASRMGRLPYRETLKDTLALAEDRNTQSFRGKLNEWSQAFEEQNIDVAERIQRDIKEASRELSAQAKIDELNRVVTYLGFPLVAVSQIQPQLQILSVLGITFTVVGVAATIQADKSKRRFGWTMFGSI